MFDPPEGIRFRPLTIRIRMRQPGPENAIATRIDVFDAIDLYFSELREDFLAGRVKRVMNVVNLRHAQIHDSHSVVGTREQDHHEYAAKNRRDLLRELAAQYKNAVTRNVGGNAKSIKRRRYRMKELGDRPHQPDQVDAYFAHEPEALAAARPIRDIWSKIAALT